MHSHPNFSAITAGLVLGLAVVVALPPAAGAKPAKPATASSEEGAPGRPLTRAEVRKLYSGKTWEWSGGGGYMDRSGKFYAAIGQDKDSGSYARGTWLADAGGRMCFAGVWRTDAKGSFGRTCFAHRIAGDTVFQRKEPSGEWYAFKNSPMSDGDEFSKLVEGDRVSEQLKQLRTVFASK